MTKKEWVDYYRKKYPNRSDAEISRLADAQVQRQSQTAGSETGITFGGDNRQTSASTSRGVRMGFGLTDDNGDALIISPGKLPSYMQKLLLKNPKAYTKVQTLVYQASGRKYSDPDSLGTWLQTIAQNLLSSSREDPSLAKVNVESVVNAAVANRASNPLFQDKEKADVPTRQIYQKTVEQVESKINKDAQEILGRTITPADMETQWYKDLRKGIRGLYNQGVVTSEEIVTNPKTGKKERVVKQVPSYSEEKITEMTTEALKTADPESAARNERIGFTKFLYSMGGQQG